MLYYRYYCYIIATIVINNNNTISVRANIADDYVRCVSSENRKTVNYCDGCRDNNKRTGKSGWCGTSYHRFRYNTISYCYYHYRYYGWCPSPALIAGVVVSIVVTMTTPTFDTRHCYLFYTYIFIYLCTMFNVVYVWRIHLDRVVARTNAIPW